MKRFLIYIMIVLTILHACSTNSNKTVANPTATPNLTIITPEPTATIQAIEETQKIVYITKTGAKYHAKHCRYTRQSCIEITENKAIKKHYIPCSVCSP